jgi:hypothetical protein
MNIEQKIIIHCNIYPSFTRQGGGKQSWVSHPPFEGNNQHLEAFWIRLGMC